MRGVTIALWNNKSSLAGLWVASFSSEPYAEVCPITSGSFLDLVTNWFPVPTDH